MKICQQTKELKIYGQLVSKVETVLIEQHTHIFDHDTFSKNRIRHNAF